MLGKAQYVPPLQPGGNNNSSLIYSRQAKFLKEIFQTRDGMDDDPLMFTLRLTEEGNKRMHKRITKLRDSGDHAAIDLASRKRSILEKDGSKFVTYARLNPTLATHRLYTDQHAIPDNLRITFTRFRTSSHRLRVELGRWTRPLTPREQRECPCDCGDVQDEKHVFSCQRTAEIRQRAGFVGGVEDLFRDASVSNLIMLKNCLAMLEDQ